MLRIFISFLLIIASEGIFREHFGTRHRGFSVLSMASKYLGDKPVFVAGGSNGVGLELVKQLSKIGTPVHALIRNPDKASFLSELPGVKTFFGDAMNEEDVQKSMEGCVAAVTLIGGVNEKGERVDYVANSNVIEQAGILGVERIVLVTSVGCGDTKSAVSKEVYRVLEEALEMKSKAERDLKMYTNLDWTIIRPGGLKTAERTGRAIVTEDKLAIGVVHREDVADMIVQVLGNERCMHRELTCIDPTLDPSYNAEDTESHYVKFAL